MSDLICRNTMTRCLTPGMCSPHGGCLPEQAPSTETVSSVWLAQLRNELLEVSRQRDELSEQMRTLKLEGRTITLSGCGFREDDLIRRAVRNVRGSRRNTLQRWALVRDAFGTGSGVATALCRRFGFDPDEVLKG
uniref:Uncharacterized protein n=1 Tax=Pseudomonas phage Touem01 TaxID=3138548 RepID=A0AAU6W341_9VIRU